MRGTRTRRGWRAALHRISSLVLCCASIAAFSTSAPAGDATLPRHSVLGAAVAEADGGVQISYLIPGGPAQSAGLHVGDIVTAVAGRAMRAPSEFLPFIGAQPNGTAIPFNVRRGNSAIVLPVVLRPAPYESDSGVQTLYQAVRVDGSLRRTLLTVPDGQDRDRPAILILGGIGCYSIDNPLDTQNAYMRLSHDLSRRGFVVMRLEKSAMGDSQGPPCMSVDLLAEMHSYETALDRLRHDPHVNPDRIYLFGHSIGTLMAPRIAEKQKLAGLIIADGVGRNWIEYELLNLRRQLVLEGQHPDQVDATIALKEVCMHQLLVEKRAEADIERAQPACKDLNAYPAPASYMQEAAELNVAQPWLKLDIPLLAIYGTADFITAEDDHQRIVDIVNAIHPGAATLRLVPGMDHYFDDAGTPQHAFDLRTRNKGAAPYDEQLSATVLNWLCARERCTVQ
jgi:alpha-beta hydrolase superfamily lysophospholipase